jgi:A nuclease family of the HNH/ENDO VII superfamily with conserved AHH
MAGNNSSSSNFSHEEPDKNLISQFVPPVAPPLAVYDVIVASAIAIEAGFFYVQWRTSKDYRLNNEEIRFDPSKTDAQAAVQEHFANKRVEIKPEAETMLNRANDHNFNLGIALRQEKEGFARHEVGPYDTRHTPEKSQGSLGGFAKQAPMDSTDTQHAPEPETSQKAFISPKGEEPLAPSIDFSKDSNRISSPYWLGKNYEDAYGKLPSGWQRHHLIPDKVVQDSPLSQEARQRAGYDLDRASNLIGVPGTAKAYQQSDVKLMHSGQHKEWNKYVKETLGKEQKLLEKEYSSLDKVPADVLQETMQEVEHKLRGDIQNIELGIKEGWVKPDYQRGNVKFNKLSEVEPAQDNGGTTQSTLSTNVVAKEVNSESKQQSIGTNDEFSRRLEEITERLRGISATHGQNGAASGTASADLEQNGAESGTDNTRAKTASADLKRAFAEYQADYERITARSGTANTELEQLNQNIKTLTAEFRNITPLVEPTIRPKLQLGGELEREPQSPSEQSEDFDQLVSERWNRSVAASLKIQQQQGEDGPVLEL